MSPIFKKKKKWQDIESFDPAWKQRIVQMANFIEPETTILDLGCGLMWLKDYLPFGCTYIPVDYCKRSNDTVISDFNKNQFPELNADIAFISGCLEYIIELAEQASPDDAGRDCQERPYQQPDNGARRVWHLGRWLDMRPAVH